MSSARAITANLAMTNPYASQPKLLDYEALIEDELDRELERFNKKKC